MDAGASKSSVIQRTVPATSEQKDDSGVLALGAAAPRADWMGFWVSQGTAVPTGRCVFMNVSQCFLRRCCSCTCSDCARDAQTCSRLALPLASTGPRARRTGNAETSATSSRPAAEGILVASPLQTLRGSASGMRSSRQLPAQPSGTQPLVQCPCWPLSRQLAGLSEHTSHLVVSIRRQNKAAAKGGGGRRLTVHPPPIPPPVPATEPAQQRHDSLACHSIALLLLNWRRHLASALRSSSAGRPGVDARACTERADDPGHDQHEESARNPTAEAHGGTARRRANVAVTPRRVQHDQQQHLSEAAHAFHSPASAGLAAEPSMGIAAHPQRSSSHMA